MSALIRNMRHRWKAIADSFALRMPNLGIVPIVMVLATAAVLCLDLWGEYRRVVADTERAATMRARLLAEQTGRLFDRVGDLLTTAAAEQERSAVAGRPSRMMELLSGLPLAARTAVGVYVADERGRVLTSWDAGRPVGAQAAETVRRSEDRLSGGLIVSEPFKRDGRWTIALVRRVGDASGRRGVLAVAEMQVGFLLRDLEETGGAVPLLRALYRNDGVLLASLPLDPGRQGVIDHAMARPTAEGDSGAWAGPAAVGDRARLGGWAQASGYPVVAAVAVDRWEALGAWRSIIVVRLLGMLCLALAVGVMATLLRRQVHGARRNDTRLRAAVDASMDAFFLLQAERDRQGEIVDFRFIDTNPNGEVALARPRHEIVGARLSTVAPRGEFEAMRRTYAMVVSTGQPVEEEIIVEGVNGTEWMQHQIVRLDDGIAITSRNVSERHMAEEKAIAAEMRLAEITASTPGAVLQYHRETDGRLRFTYVSPGITRLCGIQPRELEDDPGALVRLALPEDKERFETAIADSARRLVQLRLDYRSSSPAGPRWLRLDALPHRRVSGLVAWSGLLTDVTAEKQAEADLELAKREAEAASSTKSSFLANMSHELRTPLNAIIGFSEGLGAGVFGPLTRKQREYVEDIRGAGTHLLKIINDLLDLSKIEAGKAKLYEEVVVIGDVVDAAVALLRGHAEEKSIMLAVRVARDVPDVRADEVKLKQILVNLLSNAVKFTPESGTIVLSAEQAGDGGVTMRVRDSGHGIAAEDLGKVLQPFWQAEDTLVRKVGGTGLGLPLVHHLIGMHGGKLDIRSSLGAGTEVIVTLPSHRVIASSARRRVQS